MFCQFFLFFWDSQPPCHPVPTLNPTYSQRDVFPKIWFLYSWWLLTICQAIRWGYLTILTNRLDKHWLSSLLFTSVNNSLSRFISGLLCFVDKQKWLEELSYLCIVSSSLQVGNWQTQGPNSNWPTSKVQIAPVGEAFRTDSIGLRAARGTQITYNRGFFPAKKVLLMQRERWEVTTWLSEVTSSNLNQFDCLRLSVVIPVPVSESQWGQFPQSHQWDQFSNQK